MIWLIVIVCLLLVFALAVALVVKFMVGPSMTDSAKENDEAARKHGPDVE